jgi:hypothetical protein
MEAMAKRRWVRWILVLLGAPALIGLLLSLQKVRDEEGLVHSSRNLKAISLALRNYHEAYGQFPPATTRNQRGEPLLSWRVLLLPFLDNDNLYRQFKFDEPWDSKHNKPFSDTGPPRFYYSAWAQDDPFYTTHYQALVGPGTAFERDGLTLHDFPDGLENTILVVEAAQPVPWSKPEDLTYDPTKPLPPLGGLFRKPVYFLGLEVKRQPGFVAGFADGQTRFIAADTDEGIIRALITRNGGEQVDPGKLK